jgi:hypothetical protein
MSFCGRCRRPAGPLELSALLAKGLAHAGPCSSETSKSPIAAAEDLLGHCLNIMPAHHRCVAVGWRTNSGKRDGTVDVWACRIPRFLVMGKAGLYIKQRTVYCRPNRGNRLAGVRAHVCWRPAVVAGRAAHVPSCGSPEPGRIPAWPPAKQANNALRAALAIRKRIRFLDVASRPGYLAAAATA